RHRPRPHRPAHPLAPPDSDRQEDPATARPRAEGMAEQRTRPTDPGADSTRRLPRLAQPRHRSTGHLRPAPPGRPDRRTHHLRTGNQPVRTPDHRPPRLTDQFIGARPPTSSRPGLAELAVFAHPASAGYDAAWSASQGQRTVGCAPFVATL